MNGLPLITLLTLAAARSAAILVAGLGRDRAGFARGLALAVSLLSLAWRWCCGILRLRPPARFNSRSVMPGFPTLRIEYHVAWTGSAC